MKISLNPFSQNGKDGVSLIEPSQTNPRAVFEKTKTPPFLAGPLCRSLMKINLITLLLGLGLSQVDASTYAQQVTLKRQKTSLEAILKDFEKQSGYTFFYKKSDVSPVKGVDVDVKNMPLNQALNNVLKNANFTFEYFDKTIVIKKGRELQSQTMNRELSPNMVKVVESALQQVVRGQVLDESGNPIKGASVRVKSDPKRAIATQEDGTFNLPITALNEVIVISYLGYQSKEIKASLERNQMVVRLKKQENEVGEVIITGMMERKKETFTGATSSFTMEELKAVSNTNVIQSLKTLDPSFLIMENNLAGGNPNALPTIELRGQTSISTDGLRDEFSKDPNQPLFILDGFETSLKTIVDLDINRIASVTLLKDAASTAAYGSRASNGVVVIETIRPKAGELIFNYTTDGNIEFPDISGYNMMNAAEKIEFERLSGRFTRHYRNDSWERQEYLDSLYSFHLKEIARGVDSYWLSDPLQNSFSQRHSLLVSGGDNAITYSIGGDYRYYNGTMKGSGGKNWGTRLNIGYRGKKLNIVNQLYVSGYNSQESPYGKFSTWVNTNPYYEKRDISERYIGEVTQYDNGVSIPVSKMIHNPLYAAGLPNFDKTSNFDLTNNLKAIYQLNNALRFESSLQINKFTTKSNVFLSPLDLSFDQTPVLQRGTLRSNTRETMAYTANISAHYGKSFGNHLINGLLRAEVSDETNKGNGFFAVGFPTNSNGNPRFAYGYATDGKPEASTRITRRNSLVSSLNYSYDRRYNADLSFTYDGSTSFGTNNVYSPFFSAGLSWNLNNESFLKEVNWIDILRLRANIGITGNQNFSSYTSISTYNYYKDYNYFGQGIYLSSLGNPNLQWQKTTQSSFGLDANLFHGRMSLQVNAYRKFTDPMVVGISLPPSTALKNYPINAGELTVDGIELISRYSPIFRPSERIVWTLGLTSSSVKQTYSGFGSILETLNKSLRESKSLTKYRDGGSPNDIWSVPSLGIDPSTGNELFRKRDGTITYQYDWADEVVIANSAPKFQGVISSNLSYKGLTFGLNFRYIINQGVFNTALFNKVENITWDEMVDHNQDKRALYSRWKNIGDIAEFRKIQLNDWNKQNGIDESTKPSSRFIQKENTLTLESASLGYDLREKSWMKSARLSNLRFTGYLNEIFRWSTVKRERGIDYPFARTVSFSLSANFQ
ncbi:TonB-linked outer membrane protein, SusC/RagA family [Sphingobacterium nematocida]|uniref:TonB-linked outer membrane protein, SusC/RagA family n=1 Tax=Sphingobacterium nematocida TaxID=1513896 RepID=A0A1T5DGR2_9SPHI|nr:SusC/RagA family TonB-linked outer membrane protein [Sphingobacterium nematocida]SKB70761.1 TonB-linked outer membrane protein, SusC/RagA family [Sphingobacterium nematocida]